MILFSSSKDDDDDGDVGYQLSHGWLKNIVRDPTAVENGNGVLQLLDWQEKRIGGSQLHLFELSDGINITWQVTSSNFLATLLMRTPKFSIIEIKRASVVLGCRISIEEFVVKDNSLKLPILGDEEKSLEQAGVELSQCQSNIWFGLLYPKKKTDCYKGK